jgi:hypothetical protein
MANNKGKDKNITKHTKELVNSASLLRLYDLTQDTPHSEGLLWASYQPEAETFT